MSAAKIDISRFHVYEGPKTIEGNIIKSDTSAVFIPHVNLKHNTLYTVEINGTVTILYDVGLPSVTEGIERKWSFTTGGQPVYSMYRQSQTVTDFARDGCKMMQMGDYLYLYGGWRGGIDFSSASYSNIYRSRGDLTIWEKLADSPWSGRHTFGIGKAGSNLYIFGGDQHSEVFDVWTSSDGENFQLVAQDLGNSVTTRLIYGACTHKNKLFVLGGQSSLDNNSGLTDVWTSSNGWGWRRMSNGQNFLGKNLAGVVVSFNNKIWVVGGGYYRHPDSAERWTNHIYSSPDGLTWTREPDAPWAGRQFADVCVWDDKLWMVGGHNGKNLSDIWYMNKDGSWVEYTPSNLFTARHATAVAVYNNKLIIACGDQNNDCWIIERIK